jgi:two-component system phosphate regulon response regulator PhoB
MTGEKLRILVVDDDNDILELVRMTLSPKYEVLTVDDPVTACDTLDIYEPDLVILDIMMPGLDGLEVCKRLRQEPVTASRPILMLTAKAEEADRVLGLELGADDYVVKPFGMRELLARVKALLRRAESGSDGVEVLKVGRLVIDSGKRQVTAAGKAVALTTTEFNLLRALAERPGRVRSREELISAARGEDAEVVDRTVDVHVAALRRKLGKIGDMIETVRGVGYRLRED